MATHPLAGKPVPPELVPNVPRLVSDYYRRFPDCTQVEQRILFGTSGHRGTSQNASFNEAHIAAIAQAVVEYRASAGIRGPLLLAADTHALSEAAWVTALEVLIANGVRVQVQIDRRPTPTPAVSRAILVHNLAHPEALADGLIITPSHNPPEDGGLKYNPPNGGPADTDITSWIQDRANQLLEAGPDAVKRVTLARALGSGLLEWTDWKMPYIRDLANVLDMDAIAQSGLKLGVDPLGGASLDFWAPIAEVYGLTLDVVNPVLDASFRFMRLDKDGKIRMDCSSPCAMAGLIDLKDRYDLAMGLDPDADRHGIVSGKDGLMNPNHYLSVAIRYLFTHRPGWSDHAAVGKTLVSSSMIDRVVKSLGRRLHEVPVGFKWFVPGLSDGSVGFGGEESAGASFLRKDGRAWSTDKDGLILCLLAAEMTAVCGKTPSEQYRELVAEHGEPFYARSDAPATRAQKAMLSSLAPENVRASDLAGEPILAKLTRAPGNNAGIGGLKVVTENGWFAARPSGTEDIYKIYAESFRGEKHLAELQEAARGLISSVFEAS